MAGPNPLLTIGAALAIALAGAVWLADPSARAITTLCKEQTASVADGTYKVQNNEYDSGAPECVTTNGNGRFTVANSGIGNATDGPPGAFPSIYQGCGWGDCSSGGLTSDPIKVSNLTTGKVTTSWRTTQPGGSNAYDVAYDIWFNQTPTTSGHPDCTELMVWLNHNGRVQPSGSTIASDVAVGGHSYNIWDRARSRWNTITYEMTSGTTSVSGLDIGTLAQDAVSRGYLSRSCYLIDVEAGFELWRRGAGLKTDSFSVHISGSSLASSCPGGFQGQAVVANTGSGSDNAPPGLSWESASEVAGYNGEDAARGTGSWRCRGAVGS
jgi:hypothetical protein